MRKITLSEKDFNLFDIDLSPVEYDFFQKHRDAFKRMWHVQGKKFWIRFVLSFRSFSVNYGVIKQFPGKRDQYDSFIDQAFIYIHEQFVDGKVSTARNLILDIVVVAQNRHTIQYLESKSRAKDPFYCKETRDVFRRLFGPPGEKASYLKVYFLIGLYVKFGGSVCQCLRRWLDADDQDSADESYWTPPQSTESDKKSDKKKETKPMNLIREDKIENDFKRYMCEKNYGSADGPQFVTEWKSGDPRFSDPANPLYDLHADRNIDWREDVDYPDFLTFLSYLRGGRKYLRLGGEPIDDRIAELADRNPPPLRKHMKGVAPRNPIIILPKSSSSSPSPSPPSSPKAICGDSANSKLNKMLKSEGHKITNADKQGKLQGKPAITDNKESVRESVSKPDTKPKDVTKCQGGAKKKKSAKMMCTVQIQTENAKTEDRQQFVVKKELTPVSRNKVVKKDAATDTEEDEKVRVLDSEIERQMALDPTATRESILMDLISISVMEEMSEKGEKVSALNLECDDHGPSWTADNNRARHLKKMELVTSPIAGHAKVDNTVKVEMKLEKSAKESPTEKQQSDSQKRTMTKTYAKTVLCDKDDIDVEGEIDDPDNKNQPVNMTLKFSSSERSPPHEHDDNCSCPFSERLSQAVEEALPNMGKKARNHFDQFRRKEQTKERLRRKHQERVATKSSSPKKIDSPGELLEVQEVIDNAQKELASKRIEHYDPEREKLELELKELTEELARRDREKTRFQKIKEAAEKIGETQGKNPTIFAFTGEQSPDGNLKVITGKSLSQSDDSGKPDTGSDAAAARQPFHIPVDQLCEGSKLILIGGEAEEIYKSGLHKYGQCFSGVTEEEFVSAMHQLKEDFNKKVGGATSKVSEGKTEEKKGATPSKVTEYVSEEKKNGTAQSKVAQSKSEEKKNATAESKVTQSKSEEKKNATAESKVTQSKSEEKKNATAESKVTQSKSEEKKNATAESKVTQSKSEEKKNGVTQSKMTETKPRDKTSKVKESKEENRIGVTPCKITGDNSERKLLEKAAAKKNGKTLKTCTNCGITEETAKTFKKCQKCQQMKVSQPRYYCGRDCQAEDWKRRHRQEHTDCTL